MPRPTLNERWEQGIPHDPRTVAIYEHIEKLDIEKCGDFFCFKHGGDGDNGEHLMYLMDDYFYEQDCKTMKPDEIFGKAWDILVEHAGASADPDNKANFVLNYTTKGQTYNVTEWRFGGLLGFGGKFWRNDNRYYVSCYPEDKDKKKERVIARVNALLSILPYFEPK